MQECFKERIRTAKYIICICEGAAEFDIVSLLLKNNLLIFSEEQIVIDGLTNIRKANDIQEKFLGLGYEDKVLILRIIDSKRESFKLKPPYNKKCDIINIYTTPEIEMLLIIHHNKYDDYQKVKNRKKPSEYCKETLKLKDIKRQGYMERIFSKDVNSLICALKEYGRLAQHDKNLFICDLLKENL